ncbi:uncharacterized protein EHS24_001316 [Apiotrichum porosum]|uniref:F-box domain-containing protein n=1 Tax=Apiotrichum porosum TaxID=105984 RepID=A0A427XKA6_9TREE|nr:uncharacterized protein EHS24_001316 [Apiotrichum porosum]RSH79276.1 hypothetical protein EHS24_001316 [Apiotrichum porosum]
MKRKLADYWAQTFTTNKKTSSNSTSVTTTKQQVEYNGVKLCPDILHEIVPLLDVKTLLAVRALSREFGDRADELLFRHLEIKRFQQSGEELAQIASIGREIAQIVSIGTPHARLPLFPPRCYPVTTRHQQPELDELQERPFSARGRLPEGAWESRPSQHLPGWSSPFCAKESQWKQLEEARLHLQKVEQQIYLTAFRDREEEYKASLADYYENEDRIKRALRFTRIVDIVGVAFDHSLLATLMPNLDYVRAIPDSNDMRYSPRHWYLPRPPHPHVFLKAPVYVINSESRLQPPPDTRRVIFSTSYHVRCRMDLKFYGNLANIDELVVVFNRAPNPANVSNFDIYTSTADGLSWDQTAAMDSLVTLLASRIAFNTRAAQDEEGKRRLADHIARLSNFSVVLVGALKMISRVTHSASRSKSIPTNEAFKVILKQKMLRKAESFAHYIPDIRTYVGNLIDTMGMKTGSEWRARVPRTEYRLATTASGT